jgi:hypothetical protein
VLSFSFDRSVVFKKKTTLRPKEKDNTMVKIKRQPYRQRKKKTLAKRKRQHYRQKKNTTLCSVVFFF